MANWAYMLAGIYIMVMGLKARTFLNGSDVDATESEIAAARSAPVKRALVVALGLLITMYGTYRLARYHW